MKKTKEKEILEFFLKLPIDSSKEVLEVFSKLEKAEYYSGYNSQSFVYVPGERDDRVLLIAHADTAWDKEATGEVVENPNLISENGIYHGDSKEYGIGADDRAGCALLYLLKDSGHSLLVTDGEERGMLASKYICMLFPDLYEELNCHNYMIQFDLKGKRQYDCYDIPVSDEFICYIEQWTKFSPRKGKRGQTDICVLANEVCGVNISIGYENPHCSHEFLSYKSWLHTLNVVENMIAGQQPAYHQCYNN